MAKRKNDKLTLGARGQPCEINVVGVCVDPFRLGHDTVVACHFSWREGEKGTGCKVNNLGSMHGCAPCHAAVDGYKLSEADRYYYAGRAIQRTTIRREALGLITVKR